MSLGLLSDDPTNWGELYPNAFLDTGSSTPTQQQPSAPVYVPAPALTTPSISRIPVATQTRDVSPGSGSSWGSVLNQAAGQFSKMMQPPPHDICAPQTDYLGRRIYLPGCPKPADEQTNPYSGAVPFNFKAKPDYTWWIVGGVAAVLLLGGGMFLLGSRR